MKIDIDNVTLFFDVDGEALVPDGAVMREKPTLLLLHGGPGFDRSSLKPFFSRFADIARLRIWITAVWAEVTGGTSRRGCWNAGRMM